MNPNETTIRWLELMVHILSGAKNHTEELNKPHLRPSVAAIYPLFIFLYACIVLGGTLSNLAILWVIARKSLHHDPTYGYIANLAVANIVKCILVLPFSLAILLIQNWIFGRFLCYFLPMMQDTPLHVSTLTFLMIAIDRYRLVMDPTKPRLPVFFCAVGTWVLAVCIVLPYPIYLTYVDLGSIMEKFDGVGMCMVNLVDNMQEYMRGLFIVMYVMPLAVMAYLYVRVSRELKIQEGPIAVMMFEARTREAQSRASSSCQDFRRDSCSDSQYSQRPQGDRSNNYDLYEAELDVNKEKRTQKYLMAMVIIFAISLCPLMVLRLAKLALTETYDNSGYFDIIYTMFVWAAFLPTCSTPWLFASWRMSRRAKERIREHFRISKTNLKRNTPSLGHHQQHQNENIPRPFTDGHNNVAFTHQSGVDPTLQDSGFFHQDLTSS